MQVHVNNVHRTLSIQCSAPLPASVGLTRPRLYGRTTGGCRRLRAANVVAQFSEEMPFYRLFHTSRRGIADTTSYSLDLHLATEFVEIPSDIDSILC